MATPEAILIDNLKQSLKTAHQYLILGNGIALFLLILVIQDWRGTGEAAIITLPQIGLRAERSIVELVAGVAYFVLGYMAYLAVSRIIRIKWRLRYWPELRKAALTYPSIPTINTGMRIGAVLFPALMFFAALLIIFVPQIKKHGSDWVFVMMLIVLLASTPHILIMQLLRYPLVEITYKITEECIVSLKAEGIEQLKRKAITEEVLEKLSSMIGKEYLNKPEFLNALEKTIGKKQAEEVMRLIPGYICEEDRIED
jgi:hypothetical protein